MDGVLLFLLAVFALGGTRAPESPPVKPSPVEPPGPPPGTPQRSSTRRGRRLSLPVNGVVSAILGEERSHGPHQGIDIAAPAGAEVRAWAPGVVARVVDGRAAQRPAAQRAGLYVDVHGEDGDTHRYLHLGRALVTSGQHVDRGQLLGTVETDHLHFEVRAGRGQYGPAKDPLA